MTGVLTLISILFLSFSDSSEILAQSKNQVREIVEQNGIPQGKFEYNLQFSEWGDRMNSGSCDVIIKGKNITVLQNRDTNLTGGELIIEGILLKHKTGVWIIANKESDVNAEEIGGCSGGPVPIYFSTKTIEWC